MNAIKRLRQKKHVNQESNEKIGGLKPSPSLSTSFRTNAIRTVKRDVLDVYEIVQSLGEGTMGSVNCMRKKDKRVGGSAYPTTKDFWGKKTHLTPPGVIEQSKEKYYAVKGIQLSLVSDDHLEELDNEIKVLRSLDHPNIVKAYEVYHGKRNIHIVMEHCSGGDLYSRRPYSEEESRKIVLKLLSAVHYLHERNIVHRDLKFENIMFENAGEDAEVKLIDFGLAKKFLHGHHALLFGCVGTIHTMAPQVISSEPHNSQADLWSIGVIAYMLLSDSSPFYETSTKKIIKKVQAGEYTFYADAWENISSEAKNFVSSLIKVDPDERLTAKQAQEHGWLHQDLHVAKNKPKEETMVQIYQKLENFAEVNEFQRFALMVLAHKSSTDEILELRKAFNQFDKERNGIISLSEFRAAMEKSNEVSHSYTQDQMDEIFHNIKGKEGLIQYSGFLAATLEVHGRIVEERLAEAFDRIDSDDSGFISRKVSVGKCYLIKV